MYLYKWSIEIIIDGYLFTSKLKNIQVFPPHTSTYTHGRTHTHTHTLSFLELPFVAMNKGIAVKNLKALKNLWFKSTREKKSMKIKK